MPQDPGKPTSRPRLGDFRRNILADLELHTASDPKDVLRMAAEALERSDFVRSVRAYLLERQILKCVSEHGAAEDVALSRTDHPAVKALNRKVVSYYRQDGCIDLAVAVGSPPGAVGVIHVVFTRENIDAQLLARHLFQAASDRLRMLQPAEPQGVTAAAEEPSDHTGSLDLLDRMVHEINNPLAAILARLDILRMDRGGDPVVAEHLNVLRPQVERLAAILRNARSCVRPSPEDLRPVDAGESLRAVVLLVTPYYRSGGVELEVEWPQGLPSVIGNAAGLQQVWLNYLNNAFQAICRKEHPAGRIRVSAWYDRGLRQLAVEITDDGVGMDAETLRSLVGLRPAGGMPGIGAGEAARIIAQHKGSVHFTSAPGGGTTVRVFLPAAEADRTPPPSGDP